MDGPEAMVKLFTCDDRAPGGRTETMALTAGEHTAVRDIFKLRKRW